jgi:hypothetical protein
MHFASNVAGAMTSGDAFMSIATDTVHRRMGGRKGGPIAVLCVGRIAAGGLL